MNMVYLIGLATMLSTLVGGLVVAGRIKDRKHLALGLSGGLMLGVVFFDIVPESLRISDSYRGVSLGMLALIGGFTIVHLLQRRAHHRSDEEQQRHHINPGAAALVGHSFLDGIGIALAFQVSHALGLLFAIAVLAHDMGDGFNMYMITKSWRGVVADAIAPLAGVFVGSAVHVPNHVLGIVLGLFGGSLLYLATADILPEAHASHSTKLTHLATLIGAGAMFLVIGVLG